MRQMVEQPRPRAQSMAARATAPPRPWRCRPGSTTIETEPGEAAERDRPTQRHERPRLLEREPALGPEREVAPQTGLAGFPTECRRGEPGSGGDVFEREATEHHPWTP